MVDVHWVTSVTILISIEIRIIGIGLGIESDQVLVIKWVMKFLN